MSTELTITQPAGTYSASSQFNSSYSAAKAFDYLSTTWWQTSIGGSVPSWIQVSWGSGNNRVADRYSLQGDTDLAQNATAWTFEGYDGAAWHVLDTRSGISWTSLEVKEFSCVNTTGYEAYRIYVTAINGGVVAIFREFKIYSPVVAADNVAHRYWRCFVNEPIIAGTSYAIGELQMASTPGGANLCAGGSPIQNSYYSSSFQPAYAFDGNKNTAWTPLNLTGLPGYIGYDFGVGNAVNVNVIRVLCRAGYLNQAIKSFDVEYSDDGIHWVKKWGVTDAIFHADNLYEVFNDPALDPPATVIWGVRVATNNGNLHTDVAEVEFRTATGVPETPTGGIDYGNTGVSVNTLSKAFDGNPATFFEGTDSAVLAAYQFLYNKPVEAVMLQAYTAYLDGMPKDFTIEHSTDFGETWIVDLTITGETGWAAGEERLFTLTGPPATSTRRPIVFICT